jgi:hypothetical protein
LRCGRFTRPDGLLLCESCAPRGNLTQSVTIAGPPIHLRLNKDGSVTHLNEGETGTVTAKAQARRGRVGEKQPHLVAQRVRGLWNSDRRAHEDRETVHDRDTDLSVQRWRDPETGEVTWEKSGSDSDPDMHGRASYRPSRPDA